jgi:hypothetical protein
MIMLADVNGAVGKWMAILVAFTYKELMEQLAYIIIIWFFIEGQSANIVEECAKLRWARRAHKGKTSTPLLSEGCVALLLVSCRFDTMPREIHKESTKEHMQIIAM